MVRTVKMLLKVSSIDFRKVDIDSFSGKKVSFCTESGRGLLEKGGALYAPLKEGGTQKNKFSENLTVDTSGGFEPRVHLAEHQKRYRLRYAARKAGQLKLPICAGAFFSLNTSLNTTRVPTSFKQEF